MQGQLKLDVINFQKDAYITIEGKANANRFFIIRSGQIRIMKEAEVVEEQSGNVLQPGDFFGVVSTMSAHSHIETTQAISDVSLIGIHKDQFPNIIQKNASVAMKIIVSFSRKLRYLDEQIAKISKKESFSEEPESLFYVGEYYYKKNLYNQAYYALFKFVKYNPDHENVVKAKEMMEGIEDYAKPVFLEPTATDFKRLYPDGTTICCEHEPGDELYIIQSGNIKISKIIDNKEQIFAVLKPGEIVGEMALLENKPRTASVTAYGDTQVMAVSRQNFDKMVTSQPQMATKLIELLAERVWVLYKQLANIVITKPMGRIYDMMLIQLEKNRVPIRANATHTFEFGVKELMGMLGFSEMEGASLSEPLLQEKKLKVVDNKLMCSDLEFIQKQVEYYKKMDSLERARKKASDKKKY